MILFGKLDSGVWQDEVVRKDETRKNFLLAIRVLKD